MREPNIAVYGSTTCGDTNRATAALDAKQIQFEFKDVNLFPEFNDYIAGLNGGKRVMPTIRVNNQTYINPSVPELMQAIEEAKAAPAS